MKNIKVHFVRHGQTLFNTMNKLQGWSDSPLTEKGIITAKNTGDILAETHFDAYYSSDLKRAIDTAIYISKRNHFYQGTPIQNPDFREVYFGSFEGADNDKTWAQAGAPYGYETQNDIIMHTSFITARNYLNELDPRHLAERGSDFYERQEQALKYIITNHHDNDEILVVTHGTFIRSLVLKYAPEFDPITNYPRNGSVTTISLSSDVNQEFKIQVLHYNELS